MTQIRLTDPHPSSFLAFDCWTREYFASFDRDPRAALGPQTAERGLVARYFARRAAMLRQFNEMIAQDHLVEELSPKRAQLAGAKSLAGWIGEKLCRERAFELRELARQPPRKRNWQQDGEWHPMRDTTIDVAVGAYLIHGSSSKPETAAAHYLNRGLPDDRRGVAGLQDGHIRNALDSFSTPAFRLLGGEGRYKSSLAFQSKCLILVHEALFADAMWQLAKREVAPYHLTIERMERLAERGLLLTWRMDVEDGVNQFDPATMEAGQVGLVAYIVRMLKQRQKTLSAPSSPNRQSA